MMGPMTALDQAIGDARVVVAFPADGMSDWVPCAEVLLLEGLTTWVIPHAQLPMLAEVKALYGRRARIGVGGLTDAAAVREAVDAGAAFLLAVVATSEIAEAADEVPLVPGALTPSEVAAAKTAGFDAVQVVPVDALGASYSRGLPALVPGIDLMATGRLERYQAEMWLNAGARAVCVEGTVLQSEAASSSANNPEDVLRRAQNLGQLVATGA